MLTEPLAARAPTISSGSLRASLRAHARDNCVTRAQTVAERACGPELMPDVREHDERNRHNERDRQHEWRYLGSHGRRGLWRSRLLNVIEVGDLRHPPKRSHVQSRVLEIEVALYP
jgi:hypothetical protein